MNEANIFLQNLSDTLLCPATNISLSVLRLDVIDPVISGNKWFKLKYNLAAAKQQGFERIVTFGGAHSNHLIATAAAAKKSGFQSTGIVRGWHGATQETPTLKACREFGMILHFVSREDYARKTNPEFQQQILAQTGPAFIIPEGGQNEFGRKGAGEIARFIPANATHVCVSVGSGATFSGLRNALPGYQFLLGFAPFKKGEAILDSLRPLIQATDNYNITGDYHFGGFAKLNEMLKQFMQQAEKEALLPLDRVYTAKMFWGIRDLIAKGFFPPGSRIVGIHTGGLQGNGFT